MKIKCLVIDDEPLARKLVISHISKIENLELAGECTNAIEAGNFLRTSKVDLLFLDIQMPEINGLQFIGTLKNPPAIILTTAYRDFAPEAFDLDVVDYLLKPISFERFAKSVNKFFDKRLEGKTGEVLDSEKASAFIYLKADRKNHKIHLKEIIYIESLDDYVKVHLKEVTLVTRENISSLESILPSGSFVRIHRSFIINTQYISAISSDSIEIKGKELPIGRAFKKSAMAALSLREKKE
jgi:DNA-binding LytR/AlgR family response regulator